MLPHLRTFARGEDGAVTVDWIVLCAAIVGLSISGINKLNDGVGNLAVALSQGVQSKSVKLGD